MGVESCDFVSVFEDLHNPSSRSDHGLVASPKGVSDWPIGLQCLDDALLNKRINPDDSFCAPNQGQLSGRMNGQCFPTRI